MAALSRAANLSRNLSNFRVSHAVLRNVATKSNLTEKQEENVESGLESHHDTQRPKRDHLAVLKALARTVQPTALAPPRELFEDLFLYPKSTRKREECKAARLSGYKAAEFVLNKYPQLFPMRKPEPAWEIRKESDSVQTEQDLRAVISKMNPQDAINAYEKLINDGVVISLETKNDLLDLVGYYGTIAVDNLDNEALSASDSSSSSDSDDNQTQDDSESSDDEEPETVRHKNTWSMTNYAEKMFANMEEKNSRTYDAMILALIKHNFSDRAFELFKQMREKKFQASIFTYNSLLHKTPSCYGRGEKLWNGIKDIIENMKQDPAVLPNLGTYNALLKLCVLLPDGSDKALEIFRDMTNKGIEPSLATYSLLLRSEYYKQAYAEPEQEGKSKYRQPAHNNSLLQAVISHLETYDSLPALQHVSDVRFFNTGMGSALYCQDANAAHRLYALAETNDSMLLGGKRGQFYASFLVALARSEKSAEIVYHMYKELVPSKLIPHNWVYSELFKMVEREKMPRLVPRFYQDMKRYRVPISEQTCKGIFLALARRTSPKNHKQYVEIMEDVFFWMKKFNITISPHMISQLIRQYCAGGHLKQAWKVMNMFEEHNFYPTYTALIQLLDCCSMNRDRDEAVKVFELMAKYGKLIPKRRRSNFFDNIQMPLSKRLYINSLFENLEELDKQRAKFSGPSRTQDSETPLTEQAMTS